MTDKAPEHLSAESAKWWERCVAEFRLSTGGELACLTQAAESLDRIAECRERLKVDGLFVEGSRGLVTHPAARLEQQHRALVLQACRQLGISSPVKE